MSNSPLVTYTRISPNRTSPRNHSIDTITIHCYVGQVTAERGCSGSRFVNYDPKNGASCNYVVGYDGSIGLCVDEKDRSWCSSNGPNDHMAVTIEVASDTIHPYAVTDAALQATIDLCEDLCRRHGKKKLLWFGNKEKTLAYTPKPDEMIMTVHRWFAAKACPGEYLMDRQAAIANEVTKRLEDDTMTYDQFEDYMDQYLKERATLPAPIWAVNTGEWDRATEECLTDGSRPECFATRAEVAAMILRSKK